jgi:hypothetical protein
MRHGDAASALIPFMGAKIAINSLRKKKTFGFILYSK